MATAAASGNGAANAVTFISGTTATRMLWPESSIPSTFTICSVTRYTGGARGRILGCKVSPSQALDWLHGHHGGMRGVAYYEALMAGWSNVGVADDWLIMCGTNDGATLPGNILIDQDEIGTALGGAGSCRLNIGFNDESDWALHSLLIWDYSLGTVPRTLARQTLKQGFKYHTIDLTLSLARVVGAWNVVFLRAV